MSKERGLLNLCAVAFKARNICPFLLTEISELLAQPEQEPVVWQVIGIAGFMFVYNKPIDEVYEHHTVIPLYTAPPKREPLSEDKLDALAEANITDEGIAGYYAGFRDAEKAHGIGGGECVAT